MSRARSKTGCPLCGTAADPAFRPFCSRGCRDRDLLQWMGEGYRLPGRALTEEDLEDAPQADND